MRLQQSRRPAVRSHSPIVTETQLEPPGSADCGQSASIGGFLTAESAQESLYFVPADLGDLAGGELQLIAVLGDFGVNFFSDVRLALAQLAGDDVLERVAKFFGRISVNDVNSLERQVHQT